VKNKIKIISLSRDKATFRRFFQIRIQEADEQDKKDKEKNGGGGKFETRFQKKVKTLWMILLLFGIPISLLYIFNREPPKTIPT
jgi:hypothetical protein